MTRVVIADDQALVRLALRVLFDDEEDLQLVGEAADGREALALIRRTKPDVAVLDIRMPVMDGIETLQAVTGDPTLAGTKIIVLTTFEHDEYVFAALQAGASGFLGKDTDPAELLRAIRVVAGGEALLSPAVTCTVIREFVTRGRRKAQGNPLVKNLTEREREIVAWVAEGLTNEEIGARLTISPATVRTHVSRCMVKLYARDRAQLVVFAYQSGLVASDPA